MDTALKHRLTGAVILVLLAVLLLPELLTGSGEAAKSSSAAQNGAADGERRFEVDLTESASNPGSALPQSQPQPAVEAPIELPVPATVSPPPAATSLPAPIAETAPEKATVTPPPKVEPKVEPKAVAKAEPTPTLKAEPKAGPQTETKSAAKPTGSYYVQIGVFVNVASARRLERQLRDKKFAVVVDEITRSGKTMFRVRVGPELDRATANALAKKLAEAGHKGSVVQ